MSGGLSQDLINKVFLKSHLSEHKHVKLIDIKRDKVVLEDTDNKNRFTISISKFLKFYKEVKSKNK